MKRIGEVSTGSTLRLSLLGIIAIVVMLAPGVDGVGAPLDPAGMLPDPVARKTPPVILPEPDAATKARIVEAYGKLPLSFEVNHGQTDAQVKYLARGRGYTLFLTGTEAVLVLKNQPSAVSNQRSARTGKTKKTQKPSRTMLRMQLVGANPHPKIVGLEKLPGKSNYFIGNDPQKWHTNIPTYAKVRYGDVYPDVDLVYYGNQQQLEYDLIVAPGADPTAITLAFEGADQLEINDQGDLVLQTPAGQVIQHAPIMYQEINGVKQAINGHYALRGKDQVGFHVATYDATTPLIIDPVVLTYSSYLGGTKADIGSGIAVDAAGNAYVTGSTLSEAPTPFPTTAGTFQTALATSGFTDAFVTKLNVDGIALVYSTYLGGDNSDVGNGIAVDAAGNAYITGSTASEDNLGTPGIDEGFPTTMGAFQTALATSGFTDAFVTKLNVDGTALVYSTYLGGGDLDLGNSIDVDGTGNAYVTGSTLSEAPTAFPATAGAFQTALATSTFTDAFVTKLNPAGAGAADLVYSTYVGGSNVDVGRGIAIDAVGNAYITGFTGSADFPTTVGAFDTTLGGPVPVTDAFEIKVNPAGAGAADLVYSTYVGGSNADVGNGIAVDAAGNAYITGFTGSGDFPTTVGAFDTVCGCGAGITDAFAAKLNPAGAGAADLVYSTYLGGSLSDTGNGIALDGVGNIYLTGSTVSTDFPTAGSPFQSTLASPGITDSFVTKLNPAGTGAADLVYSTYLGGNAADIGNGIALDPLDNAYAVGETVSPNFPTASFQATFGGVTDAFISKITESAPSPAPAPAADGGTGCFIATAAFGSALAPQVHLLREFRDRYLLTHSVGQAFVSLYYTLSPPMAGFIADSETLRAIARVGLVPIIGWAALILWSPTLGLGILLMATGLGAWLTLRFTLIHYSARTSPAAPLTANGTGSSRTALWRWLTLWSCILFVLSTAVFLEAAQGEQVQARSRVELVGNVVLPQATKFGLIRDPESAHLGLYKDGEAIFAGEQPLPVGKVVAVHDHALVITLASGQSVEIPQGARLPGPYGLVFVRSVLIDTLRFQIRVAAAGTPDRNYSVVDIRGRHAILQRDAIPGESRKATLAEMVNTIPFVEVAPDTWEVPGQSVKQLGNHVGPLLTETLRSASPTVTMKDGVGLKLHNSLGSGTLDRRGFKIGYAKMAQRTGLEVGDVIVSVNEQPVNSAGGLVRIYRQLKSDSSVSDVKVVIERNNTLRTLTYHIR